MADGANVAVASRVARGAVVRGAPFLRGVTTIGVEQRIVQVLVSHRRLLPGGLLGRLHYLFHALCQHSVAFNRVDRTFYGRLLPRFLGHLAN